MFVGFALIFIAVVCSETKFSFLQQKKELTKPEQVRIIRYNNHTW